MDEERQIVSDWVNPPRDVEQISLWEVLHDAGIRSIESNLLACSMKMDFDVPYLRSFHHLADDLTFRLIFLEVQSVRVFRHKKWPGDFSLPKEISRDEEKRLRSEYHSKWREESGSWDEFEAQVARDNDAFDVGSAELILGRDSVVALNLGLLSSDGSEWLTVFVRAKSLDITQSDGKKLTIQNFLKLGKAYWEAFARKET